MDADVTSEILAFDRWQLDRRAGKLLRRETDGRWTAVPIGTRALELLALLLEREGAVVSKDAVMRAVWPGITVEANNVSVQIAALRRVLDEGEEGDSCIQTIAGRGYRFTLPVTRQVEDDGPPARAPSPTPSPVPEVHPGAAPTEPQPHRVGRGMLAALVIILTASLTAGAIWWRHEHASRRPVAYSPQDRRLSVIVLPFENASGDPAQDSTAESLTRQVTDFLSQHHDGGPVVPAATAASYRGKTPDLRAIAREYDVHFVVTGSAQYRNGHLLAAATVFEADGLRPVWSEQFDRPDGSDAITHVASIIRAGAWQSALDTESARAMREHPDDLDKRDLMITAKSTALFAQTKANDLAALALMERALALDPNYIWALREAARMHAGIVNAGYSADRDADLAAAASLIDRALALDPNNPWTLREQANVLRAQGRLDDAVALLHRVIEMLPNEAFRRRELGQIQMMQGHYQEALDNLLTARRLAVEDDFVPLIDANIATALLLNDRYPEAEAAARLAIGEYPVAVSGREADTAWLTLIAAENADGDDAAARADLHRFLATQRILHSMAAIQQYPYLAALPPLQDHLRRAGMPEN